MSRTIEEIEKDLIAERKIWASQQKWSTEEAISLVTIERLKQELDQAKKEARDE